MWARRFLWVKDEEGERVSALVAATVVADAEGRRGLEREGVLGWGVGLRRRLRGWWFGGLVVWWFG